MSSILLEVNGKEYSNFDSASVLLNLDAIADVFNFSAVSTKAQPMPFNQGDKCSVIIDGTRVLTGAIEIIEVSYSSSSHNISVSGRDKTADIVDSAINSMELTGNITLKEIIEKVIAHIGATDIKVIDLAGDIDEFNAAEDKISPEVGENAFEFIEKMARKRQVLLTSDGDGNVVMTQTGKDIAPSNFQNVIGASDNNIEAASVSYDDTNRFYNYLCKSQLNVSTLNFSGEVKSTEIVSQKSKIANDIEIRKSRQCVIQSESASSDEQTEARIKWEANVRKARGKIYSVEINSFSVDGNLWLPNQLVPVKDDFVGIYDTMLINTVEFFQEPSGSGASISMVTKDSYSLKLNEPAKGGKVGVGLTPQFN